MLATGPRWAVLVTGCCLLVNQAYALACSSSGLCSVGKTRQFKGDIAEASQLRAMLESVSYERELILTCVTAQHNDPHLNGPWIDQILQLIQELEGLGYGHNLVLSPTSLECDLLHKHLPQVSCAWDSTRLNLWGKPREGTKNRVVWFNRWKLFARASRLGYNIMNLDGDFIWFRDPYQNIKRPPMSNIQLWCNPSSGQPMFCNGGFIYVQNARPDGPVSWIFKQFVSNQMWMIDDKYSIAPENPGCYSDDQELLYDNIQSAFVGRPLLPASVLHCRTPEWSIKTRIGTKLTKEQVMRNSKQMLGPREYYYNITQVKPPADWFLGIVPEEEEWTNMLVNSLTVPNLKFGYPDELGAGIASASTARGPHVLAWEEQLKKDCPDCPWWKETRPLPRGQDELQLELGPFWNGTGGKHAERRFWDAGLPTEFIGIGPAWLSNSMFGYRVGMWAGPAANLPAPFAMGHVCYWKDLTRGHKTMVRKALGRYNFTLGSEVLPDGPYQAKFSPSRVLALHPDIDLRRLRSMEEFNRVVLGLIQVGHLTHRTVLLPDLPCEAPWMHDAELHGTKACKAPFNQGRLRSKLPSNAPYPADAGNTLLGGWLGQTWPPSPAGSEDEQLSGASEGATHVTSTNTASIMTPADKEVLWRKQSKWMFALGYLWDQPCTKDIGLPGAITTSEFAWWKSQHLPSQAEKPGRKPPPVHSPDDENTVLLPEKETARLLKALATEEDRGQGWVMVPKESPGWSIADAQVLLPAGQVVHTLSKYAQQPLLYLGHPVAVINSTYRHHRGDTHSHGTVHAQAHEAAPRSLLVASQPGTQGKSHVITVAQLDKHLDTINHQVLSSNCRLMLVEVETYSTPAVGPVDVSFPKAMLGIVKNGKVELLKGASHDS